MRIDGRLLSVANVYITIAHVIHMVRGSRCSSVQPTRSELGRDRKVDVIRVKELLIPRSTVRTSEVSSEASSTPLFADNKYWMS